MTNPTIIIPGKLESEANMQPYQKKEFPKAVYKGSLENCIIINCEEERPEDYVDYDDIVGGETKPENTDVSREAEIAKKEAADAEKEYRAGIMEYLDEHEVDYAKNLSTPKLEELKVALDEHLGHQDPEDESD